MPTRSDILGLFRLKGKVAIVTGAGSGIGKGIALALAGAGAHTVIVDKNETTARQTAAELNRLGLSSTAIAAADVAIKEEVQGAVEETLKKFGHIDILVNNAGIAGANSKPEDLPEEFWDRVLRVNLTGAFLFAQAVGRVMIQQRGGKIINIASILGQQARRHDNHLDYSVSKAGIIMLTKVLAVEWGKYGITVNCIAPGLFITPMTEKFYDSADKIEEAVRNTPLGRLGKLEDVGATAVFLASPASDYITGAVIPVDGGRTLWYP